MIVYCQAGQRGYYAARILMQNGFKVKNLSIFRKKYPSGNNILLARDCVKPYMITSGGMRIKVIGIKDIAKIGRV